MFPMIDKNSYIPAYIQIKEHFLNLIETNVLKPGDQIPPEHEIVRVTGISRMTVRQGIQKLVQMGHLKAQRGLGTFVAHHTSQIDTMSFSSLSKKLSLHNQVMKSDIKIFEERNVVTKVAEALSLSVNSPVWYVERIRYIDNKVSLHEISYLPKDMFPTLTAQDLKESKYSWIQKAVSNSILYTEKSYYPLIADKSTSKILKVKENTPIIKMEMTSYLDNHQAFEYSILYFSPDHPLHTLQTYKD